MSEFSKVAREVARARQSARRLSSGATSGKAAYLFKRAKKLRKIAERVKQRKDFS